MCSNEPPCLTQNEPPCLVHVRVHACMHACTHESFFFSALKKNNCQQKCVQTSPRVSRRTSPRVSCTYVCMHACMHAHTNLFFFRPSKKTIANKSVFKRAPVSHAERAPVSRARARRTCACTHARIYYYFFISSCLPHHKCAQTSPQVLMGLCARSNEPPSFDGPLCSLKRAPKFWRRCCCLCRPPSGPKRAPMFRAWRSINK